MKRYSGVMFNDTVDVVNNLAVSFWTQGCPHRCYNCHNPQTWDYSGGKSLPDNYIDSIINGLNKNGISRDLSILGGEPLCDNNIDIVRDLVYRVRYELPETFIYVWSGNTFENLIKDTKTRILLSKIDILIDGPYMDDNRDITLPLRGSTNQRVLNLNESLKRNVPVQISNINNIKEECLCENLRT